MQKLASEVNADRKAGICSGRSSNFHDPFDRYAGASLVCRHDKGVAACLCVAAYSRRCRSLLAVEEV